MKLLVWLPYRYDDLAWKMRLEGLIEAYRGHGHRAPLAVEARGWEKDLAGADLVHAHLTGIWSEGLQPLARACRERGIPIGATFHDYRNWNVIRAGRIRAQEPSAREKDRLGAFLDGCRWVTALSPSLAADLSRSLPRLRGRVRAVPVGFDRSEIAAAPPARAGARPFVLCVGRELPYKGIDVLLMAWAQACEKLPGVDLVVCGLDVAPEYHRGLARALGIGARTRLLGRLPRRGLLGLMKSCLFYVQPSRRESFGVAVLEALACGKAVLSTRCGIPEELVEDGVTGLTAPSGDVEALRDGLLRLLRDETLRRLLGRNAAARAQRYEWPKVAAAYLELDRDLRRR